MIKMTQNLKNNSGIHDISPQQVSELVEQFYARIRKDERLGPIFAQHAGGHWEKHLNTMKSFWCSVLLRTGEYQGRPVPAHQKIEGITTEDFDRWLELFSITANEMFTPEIADLTVITAGRIATSLWLARSTEIAATPPARWTKTGLGKNELQKKEIYSVNC